MYQVKRINLFAKQKKYLQVEKYFSWLRYGLIILVALFVVFNIFSFTVLSKEQQKIKSLNVTSKQYLDFLIKNNDIEAKFIFYKNKNNEFNKIISNDVNFLPYYQVLNESIKNSTSTALLSALTINKDRTTDFSILVGHYDSALVFIKYAETEDFLKNFEALTLTEFSGQLKSKSQTVDSGDNSITLTFKGKFKKLNEN